MGEPSKHLRWCDARAIYMLVGECCELGADSRIWRTHMLDRLNRILGAVASTDIDATVGQLQSGEDAIVNAAVLVDDLSANERVVLKQCMQNLRVADNPLGLELTRRANMHGTVAGTRHTHVAKEDWFRSPMYQECFRHVGWDDILCGLSFSPSGMRVVSMSRDRGDSPFPARAASVLRLFLSEIQSISTTRLQTQVGSDSLLDLPPRLFDVLVALADGDNEKQIALRLGISRNTVHEYVRRLFARYGVSSRGELLVRCARQIHAYHVSRELKGQLHWTFERGDRR